MPRVSKAFVLPSILVTDSTIREFVKGERMAEILHMTKWQPWTPLNS